MTLTLGPWFLASDDTVRHSTTITIIQPIIVFIITS